MEQSISLPVFHPGEPLYEQLYRHLVEELRRGRPAPGGKMPSKRQLCAQLFRETDLLRIFAEPFADNTASCRVLEKAGFQLEGVLRKNAVKNGAVRDMKLYALVREEARL